MTSHFEPLLARHVRFIGYASLTGLRKSSPSLGRNRKSAIGTRCPPCRRSRSSEPVPHVESTHGLRRRFKGRVFTAASTQPLRNISLPHCSRVSQRQFCVIFFRKRRTVFIVGQSRIHLDEVERLGSFLEVEVVLRPEQTVAEGERIATALRRDLEVQEQDLIDVAYIELLKR